MIEQLHEKYIKGYRESQLSKAIAKLLPENVKSLVDIGCGNGRIASNLQQLCNIPLVAGYDILPQHATYIPVKKYTNPLPVEDDAYDYSLLCDVLHHEEYQVALLKEALRIARKGVIIKDHIYCSRLERALLQFMDRTGNKRFGIVLPFKYLTKSQWTRLYYECNAKQAYSAPIRVHPKLLSLIFPTNLHFISIVTK